VLSDCLTTYSEEEEEEQGDPSYRGQGPPAGHVIGKGLGMSRKKPFGHSFGRGGGSLYRRGRAGGGGGRGRAGGAWGEEDKQEEAEPEAEQVFNVTCMCVQLFKQDVVTPDKSVKTAEQSRGEPFEAENKHYHTPNRHVHVNDLPSV